MKKIHAMWVAAIAATTLVAAPIAAAAEPAPPAPVSAPATESAPPALDPDGLLHAYYGFGLTNYCDSWLSHSTHWGVCRNKTASLWNNGYPGGLDDVLVFWGTSYTGSYRGVHNGVALGDLRQWTFDNTGLPGSNEWLYNNISSHKWINL